MSAAASYGQMGAGILSMTASAILGDQDVRERINRYKDAINLAPLDVNAVTTDSIRGMESQFAPATALGSRINAYNADELNKLMEASYPGYAKQQGMFSSNLESYLKGEIPSDVSSAVTRAGAGKALVGGYSGSGMHRNLVARDLGRTSLDIQSKGMETFMRVPSAFPRANPIDASQLMGLSPAQLIQLRAKERSDKQALLAGFAQMPTSSGSWANYTGQMGSMMLGSGMGGMGGGGGGGMGGGGGYNTGLYSQGMTSMPTSGGPSFSGGGY